MTTPDLTHYHAVHRQQRTDTAPLVVALETAKAIDRRRSGRLLPLAKWATGLGHELHVHHTVEDNIFFPAVVERVPAMLALFDQLDADHVVVSDLLERLGPSVAAVADPSFPMADARDAALSVAVELRDLLQRHLDVEDDEVLPAITHHFTSDEFEALTALATKSLPKKGITFAVPWNVESVTDLEVRATMLAAAPLPLRVLYRLTRRSYLRLVDAAFDGVAVQEFALR
jgi:iron-sulfur cluster repair protein YtfE (RIC family)